MGSENSKAVKNAYVQNRNLCDDSIQEVLPDILGCDAKGTVLCSEEEDTLTCLNGGVCALFLKEVEDSCERRCKCSTDYIGQYCEFYNGFFTATVSIMVGCLIALIMLLFFVIIFCYWCQKRRRRNQAIEAEVATDTRTASRAILFNRMDDGNGMEALTTSNYPHYNGRNTMDTDQMQYSAGPMQQAVPIQGDSTSRSYSIYDNITNGATEDPELTINEDEMDNADTRESRQLLDREPDEERRISPEKDQTFSTISNNNNINKNPQIDPTGHSPYLKSESRYAFNPNPTLESTT